MNHPAPSQKAVSTAEPNACFHAGAPDSAISNKPVPQNAITMTL
jgi:hypothetical protein